MQMSLKKFVNHFTSQNRCNVNGGPSTNKSRPTKGKEYDISMLMDECIYSKSKN